MKLDTGNTVQVAASGTAPEAVLCEFSGMTTTSERR